MTDDLAAMFAAARQDIDSEPFAHQDALDAAISTYVPVTPSGGAGCPMVLGVAAIALLVVVVVVAQIVMAVQS